jgi:hypothetical protein
MSEQDPDATGMVNVAREADRARRQSALDEILRDAAAIHALRVSDLPLTQAQRALLQHGRSQLGERLFDFAAQWHALGGRFALDAPDRARPVVDPRLSLELRAEAPAQSSGSSVALGEARVEGGAEPSSAPNAVPAPRVERVVDRGVAPVATVEALTSLKSRLEGGAARFVHEVPAIDWTSKLVQVVSGLVPSGDSEIDLTRLRVQIERIEEWVHFPRDVQRMLLGMCACRLRHLQDERGVMDRRLDSSFSTLTAYSARERPGAVRGLARFHRPTRETWAEDAEAWWVRLQSVVPAELENTVAPSHQKLLDQIERLTKEIELAPVAAAPAVRSQTVREIGAALKAGVPARHRHLVRLATPLVELLVNPEFRLLRRAIREEIDALSHDAEEDERPMPIPPEWPWWSKTRGRRALMIGGSPREPNRERLEQVFQFGSLEWEGTEFRRNALLTVRSRVESGGVDLLIFLRSFVGHDADQILIPACREHDVDWVHVEHGYGIARVKSAIERYLDP